MTTLPDTPFARVDRAKVERNVARLRAHLDGLGVTWRPHVKTSGSRGCAGAGST